MAVILLTAAEPRGAATLSLGQGVEIALDENASTGYRWALEPVSPAIIALAGQSTDPGLTPGAAGRVRFAFKAVGTGRVTLRFDLRRSWETGVAPADSRSVDLNIGG